MFYLNMFTNKASFNIMAVLERGALPRSSRCLADAAAETNSPRARVVASLWHMETIPRSERLLRQREALSREQDRWRSEAEGPFNAPGRTAEGRESIISPSSYKELLGGNAGPTATNTHLVRPRRRRGRTSSHSNVVLLPDKHPNAAKGGGHHPAPGLSWLLDFGHQLAPKPQPTARRPHPIVPSPVATHRTPLMLSHSSQAQPARRAHQHQLRQRERYRGLAGAGGGGGGGPHAFSPETTTARTTAAPAPATSGTSLKRPVRVVVIRASGLAKADSSLLAKNRGNPN